MEKSESAKEFEMLFRITDIVCAWKLLTFLSKLIDSHHQ